MITGWELRDAPMTVRNAKEEPRQTSTILPGQMEIHIQTHSPVLCGSITHGLTLFLVSHISYDPGQARE
jgi:hypothetical protein